MIGRIIKTLIASLMLGTLACCCVSLNQTQTRAATLPDKKMSDPGRASTAEATLQRIDGVEKASLASAHPELDKPAQARQWNETAMKLAISFISAG